MEKQLFIKQDPDFTYGFEEESSNSDDSNKSNLFFVSESGSNYSSTNHDDIEIKTENIDEIAIESDVKICNIFPQTTKEEYLNCLDNFHYDSTTLNENYNESVDEFPIDFTSVTTDTKEQLFVETVLPQEDDYCAKFDKLFTPDLIPAVEDVETSSSKILVCAEKVEKRELFAKTRALVERLTEPWLHNKEFMHRHEVFADKDENGECSTVSLSFGERIVKPCSVVLDRHEVSQYFSTHPVVKSKKECAITAISALQAKDTRKTTLQSCKVLSRKGVKRKKENASAEIAEISALQAELAPKMILQSIDEEEEIPAVELAEDSGSDDTVYLEALPWNHIKWLKKSNASKSRKLLLLTRPSKHVKPSISKYKKSKNKSQFNSHSDSENSVSDIDIETVEENFNPIPLLLQKSLKEKQLLSKLKKQKKGKIVIIDNVTCSICKRNFRKLADLKIHMKAKHENIPVNNALVPSNDVINKYLCSFCTCVFKHQQNLRAHFKLEHMSSNEENINIVIGTSETGGKNVYSNEDTNEINLMLDKTLSNSLQPQNGINVAITEKILFTCEFCNINFNNKHVLEIHIKRSHLLNYSENPLLTNTKKCNTNKINDECTTVQNIYSDKNASNNFRCPYCGRSFKSERSLISHCSSIHGENVSVSTSNDSNSSLQFDIVQPFFCKYCPSTFTTQYNLHRHEKMSHLFPCHKCQNRFSSKFQVELHQQCCKKIALSNITMADESPDAIFTRNAYIVKYTPQSSEINDACNDEGSQNVKIKIGFACKVCSQYFSEPKLFYVHSFTHTRHTEEINDCLTCKSKFLFIWQLVDHSKKVHNDTFPFKCKICLRGFANKLNLVKHVVQYHNCEIIYCIHCRNDIPSDMFFRAHFNACCLRTPACSLCIKVLHINDDLVAHMKDHINAKTGLHCDECLNFFYTRKNLECHKSVIHPKLTDR